MVKKYLLFIFSFETLSLKRSNIFNFTAILVVTGLILIEILIRLSVPKNHYPAGHWWNLQIRDKTYQFEELSYVDIIFMGSSVSSVNIPPESFDNEMGENGISITSFNAGIPGSDWEGLSVGYEKLFWKRKQSKYIVLVISPSDLDETNKSVRKRTATFIETLNMPFYQTAIVDLLSNSWLFGFRNEIRVLLKTFQWKSEPFTGIGIRGYTPMDRGCTFNVEFPVTIDKSGIISKSLVRLVNNITSQDKNVKVIIIEALMHSKLRKYNSNKLDNFYNLLRDLQKIERTVFLDAKNIIPTDEYFIDPFHLNEAGANLYARNLAKQFVLQNIFVTP
jgi:hypothetical protein